MQAVLLSQQFLADEFGEAGEGPDLLPVGEMARANTITEYGRRNRTILSASIVRRGGGGERDRDKQVRHSRDFRLSQRR